MALGALVLLGGAILPVDRASALEIGDPVPATTVAMKNVDGHDMTLAEVAGDRGTLVIFSCNACPWVKAWEERIAAIGNAYRQRGIGVIAVNSNDPTVTEEDDFKEMQKHARQRGFQFPYVVDTGSELARAFGATRTPEAFLFGADGKLAYHGTIDNRPQQSESVTEYYLRDALEALLAGHDAPVKETKAVGCTIKFRPEVASHPVVSKQSNRSSPHGG